MCNVNAFQLMFCFLNTFSKVDNLGCCCVAIKKIHPGTQTETNIFLMPKQLMWYGGMQCHFLGMKDNWKGPSFLTILECKQWRTKILLIAKLKD